MPRVSVVIPTRRRPDLLGRCLDAVCAAAAALPRGAVEVIVADDAGDDATRRCADSFGAREASVRYIRVEGSHGPAAARNAGWRAAKGEIIAFTDDDCIPAPGWLAAGLGAFDAPGVVGVSGRLVMPLPANNGARPTDYELNAAQLARSEFVTANCFYRRSALEAVGGFDERFRRAWREDSDLYFSLLERSNGSGPAAFLRAEDAVVVHPIRPARWGVSVAQQARNRYNALLYKKHAQLYREKCGPVTPWHYYGIVGSLLAFIAAVALRQRFGALTAGLVWLQLTGRFFALRIRHTSRAPLRVAEMLVTSVLIPPVALYWRLRGAVEHRARFL